VRFDFGAFWHFTKRIWFQVLKPTSSLSLRRVAWFAGFYLLFPWFELVHWICFLLDDLLYPAYRQQPVHAPVFIVGNPRSGTTFLQRLLSKDEATFTTTALWEVLLAPSITQRALIRGLGTLDRLLGSPTKRVMRRVEQHWREENVMHRVAWRAPEEDQYVLLHIWSTLAVWVFSGLLDDADPYLYFDQRLPERARARVMRFYRRCVQRHLYAHGGQRVYLSKNPSASPKIDALYAWFPDAKVIYLARSPLNVIPSYVSLLQYTWHVLGASPGDEAGRDFVLRMADHWYRYPLERLSQAAPDQYIVVRFPDMVHDPAKTVSAIYERFGLEISPAFARELHEATERSRNYTSKHDYSLAQFGLTREEIVRQFADVFECFGFDDGLGDADRPADVAPQLADPPRLRAGRIRRRRRRALRSASDV
jgi:hypothetical protein